MSDANENENAADEWDALYADGNVPDPSIKCLAAATERAFAAVRQYTHDDRGRPRQTYSFAEEDAEQVRADVAAANQELMEAKREAVRIINNKYYALRNDGGRVAVAYYALNQDRPEIEVKLQNYKEFLAGIENLSMPMEIEFRARLRTVTVKPAPVLQVWFKHEERASFEGVTVDPSTTDLNVNGYLNLWRGFAVKPRKGSWRLMRRHIWEVLADRDREAFRYIMRWIAWVLQNPGELAETALCLVGDQGTGKSTVGSWMISIFGQHAMRPMSANQITGKFNASIRDKVFCNLDEAINPDSRAAANTFKGITTDKYLFVEPKGKEVIPIKNRLSVMVISNHEHFVDVEQGDRRHAVFRVSSKHKQGDDYFKKLYAEVGQGGLEAFLNGMLSMNLKGWHPRYGIPNTLERRRQQARSLHGQWKLIHDMLASGHAPYKDKDGVDFILIEDMVALAKRDKIDATAVGIGRAMTALGFERIRKQPQLRNLSGYIMPPLSKARQIWVDAGRAFDWDDEQEDWSRIHLEKPF